MQPRNTCNIPRPPPLRVQSAAAWLNAILRSAARRWHEKGSVFEHASSPDGDLVLLDGPVLLGTHFSVVRSHRTVATSVTVGSHVQSAPSAVRVHVLAQALGVGAGLAVDAPRTPPTLLSRLPPDIEDVICGRSTSEERFALKRRLRRHHLERIRLNEAPEILVGPDGRLIEYRF